MTAATARPGLRPHPAWVAPPPGPAARSLARLLVEGAALLRQLGDPAQPPAASQRQQATRLLLLAEACLAALGPVPEPAAPEAEAAAGPLARVAALTPREREVLALLATGETDRQIAVRLGVAHRTATTHVGRILGKLGVPSRAAASSLAVRAGCA